MLNQSRIRGKIDGTINFLDPKQNNGLITGSDGKTYFLTRENIISGDKNKQIYANEKVLFIPTQLKGSTLIANDIELLD